jgi:hypothetical protein
MKNIVLLKNFCPVHSLCSPHDLFLFRKISYGWEVWSFLNLLDDEGLMNLVVASSLHLLAFSQSSVELRSQGLSTKSFDHNKL